MRRLLPLAMRALLGALLLGMLAGPAAAVQISFSVQDLPDAPAGPDRWRYLYQLDSFPYDAGWGFTVYFDPLLYGAVETPLPAVPAGWDALAVQPDPGSFDGFYDAEATVDGAPVAGVFAVVFTWLGSGQPGAQPFDVRDPSLLAVEQGTTVPEPAAGAASLLALASLRRAARRRAPPRAGR